MLNDNIKWYTCIKKKVQTLGCIRICSSLLGKEHGNHVTSAVFKQDWTKHWRMCYIARAEEKEDEQDETDRKTSESRMGGRGRRKKKSKLWEWLEKKNPKGSVEATFLCALAIASSCVSMRFLIITINVRFKGRGEEWMKSMGSLKAGRKKAKKASTHSEEDWSKGWQQNQTDLVDLTPHCSSAIKHGFKTVDQVSQEDHNNVFVKYFELYKRQSLPNC